MWKAFTSALLAVALTVLAGCGSLGSDRPGDGASPAEGPTSTGGGGTANGAEAADRSPPGKPAPPVPEANARNSELFARATELAEAGRLVEAQALLEEITSNQPELAGPWVNLAQVYQAQDRPDDALEALKRAVAANPANCPARTDLGVLLRRRGDFPGAESQYLACLEYQPDYRPAYLNLGILYDLYLGRLEDALAAYRHYQALSPEPDRRVNGWLVDLERRLGS